MSETKTETVAERMERSAVTVRDIRAKWEAAAAAGDLRAARLLRECFGGETPEIVDSPAPEPVLSHLSASAPREPGEDDS
jgi:hypothetical protein